MGRGTLCVREGVPTGTPVIVLPKWESASAFCRGSGRGRGRTVPLTLTGLCHCHTHTRKSRRQ